MDKKQWWVGVPVVALVCLGSYTFGAMSHSSGLHARAATGDSLAGTPTHPLASSPPSTSSSSSPSVSEANNVRIQVGPAQALSQWDGAFAVAGSTPVPSASSTSTVAGIALASEQNVTSLVQSLGTNPGVLDDRMGKVPPKQLGLPPWPVEAKPGNGHGHGRLHGHGHEGKAGD